jgi:hypothetical protein
MLGHFALGCFVGLVLIPVVVFGPRGALETTATFVDQTILPGLTTRPGALSRELTDMTGTDNQSVRAIIHNVVNWGAERPPRASTGTNLAHLLVSAVLVGATMIGARRIADARYRDLFLLSALAILSVAVTPVNHTHYMALAIPAVLGLVNREAERSGSVRWGTALTVVVVLHIASGVYPRLPFVPGYQAARELGMTMFGALIVWGGALWIPAVRREPGPAPFKCESTGALRLPSGAALK